MSSQSEERHAPAAGLRSVDEHRAVVAALVNAAPTVSVAVSAARGLVLAEDLRSPIALPPFDNSGMDGYAVRAADVASATEDHPVVLPVEQDIPAGRLDSPALRPGTAHRIMTGAPVPPGADSVVQVEHTDGGIGQVEIRRSAEPGLSIRRTGEDVTAGTVVLPAGTVLGAAQLGLAAAVGSADLPVHRPPTVLVLSTGSELVAPGLPLQRGQIYESNSTMLAAAVEDAGGRAEVLHFVPDDVGAFTETLQQRIAGSTGGIDLVLTSGGVSAGAYEVVKDALSDHGVEFVKVAMQPGGPQGAGRLEGSGVGVVTLPGNPVSSQVSFEVFVRPALRTAIGHPYPRRPVVRARVAEPLASPAGRRQFRRGQIDAATGTVRPVGGAGSHLLASLAKADCLIVVPEGTTRVPADTEVEVWLLDA